MQDKLRQVSLVTTCIFDDTDYWYVLAFSETIARQAKVDFFLVLDFYGFVHFSLSRLHTRKRDALCEWAESAEVRADHALPVWLQSNKSAEYSDCGLKLDFFMHKQRRRVPKY
jgi:hypothetical protein